MRIRIDFHESLSVRQASFRRCWYYVSNGIHTVADLKYELRKKFLKSSKEFNPISLFLMGFELPSFEEIRILKDDDIIQVLPDSPFEHALHRKVIGQYEGNGDDDEIGRISSMRSRALIHKDYKSNSSGSDIEETEKEVSQTKKRSVPSSLSPDGTPTKPLSKRRKTDHINGPTPSTNNTPKIQHHKPSVLPCILPQPVNGNNEDGRLPSVLSSTHTITTSSQPSKPLISPGTKTQRLPTSSSPSSLTKVHKSSALPPQPQSQSRQSSANGSLSKPLNKPSQSQSQGHKHIRFDDDDEESSSVDDSESSVETPAQTPLCTVVPPVVATHSSTTSSDYPPSRLANNARKVDNVPAWIRNSGAKIVGLGVDIGVGAGTAERSSSVTTIASSTDPANRVAVGRPASEFANDRPRGMMASESQTRDTGDSLTSSRPVSHSSHQHGTNGARNTAGIPKGAPGNRGYGSYSGRSQSGRERSGNDHYRSSSPRIASNNFNKINHSSSSSSSSSSDKGKGQRLVDVQLEEGEYDEEDLEGYVMGNELVERDFRKQPYSVIASVVHPTGDFHHRNSECADGVGDETYAQYPLIPLSSLKAGDVIAYKTVVLCENTWRPVLSPFHIATVEASVSADGSVLLVEDGDLDGLQFRLSRADIGEVRLVRSLGGPTGPPTTKASLTIKGQQGSEDQSRLDEVALEVEDTEELRSSVSLLDEFKGEMERRRAELMSETDRRTD